MGSGAKQEERVRTLPKSQIRLVKNLQGSHEIDPPDGQFQTEYVKYGTQTKLMHIYIKP